MKMTGEKAVKNLNPQMSDGAEEPLAMKPRVPRKSREAKLNLTGDFDPSQTVERMTDLLHPFGYYERIILDFSNTSDIKPGELYRLFAELSKCPHFNYIEIRIEGLQFSYEIGSTEFVDDQD
jgi:hypothetical protein